MKKIFQEQQKDMNPSSRIERKKGFIKEQPIVTAIVTTALITLIGFIIGHSINSWGTDAKIYRIAVQAKENAYYLDALERFKEIPDYKDSEKQIADIYASMYSVASSMIDSKDYYGENLKSYLHYLAAQQEYKEDALEMLDVLQQGQADAAEQDAAILRATEPYEGMGETDVRNSAWGEPTEVEYGLNYDAKVETRRSKTLKWIEKDSNGNVTEIKSVMIKSGVVLGDPQVISYTEDR